MKRQCYLLTFALLLVLAGCGAASAAGASVTTPTVVAVHVVRFSHSYQYPRLDVLMTDAAKAQHLYAAIETLPPYPKGMVSCNVDLDIQYSVSITFRNAPAQQMLINASGCQYVAVKKDDWRAPTPAFYALLASAIGVSVPDLFPKPPAS
ncbi:MAG: hypothetical protein ACRDHP_07710 [Ktedonobacterales bacterium]